MKNEDGNQELFYTSMLKLPLISTVSAYVK